MYKKILIPMALDHGLGAETMKAARKLLDAGGEIHALHVHETPQGSVSSYLDEDMVRDAFEASRKRLNDRVSDQDDVIPVLRKGHTARAIIGYAEEIGAECIVIGSQKPGLSDYLLGTTASRVVRHASCAVFVIRTSK